MSERERQQKLQTLKRAERTLRLVVHGQGLDKVTRQHLERAMNHLQEGYIAIAVPGCSRTVDQLVADNCGCIGEGGRETPVG